MTFIRFLFILALAVPLSVFMVYLLNKLATEFNDQQKKVKEDKENVGGSSRTSHDSVHRERVPRRQAADVKTEKKSKRQRRKERKLKKKDKEK